MISTKIRYIDFWASEWLEGTAELDNPTRGLYITACALIYARGDPLGIGVDLLKAACLDHGHAFKRQFQRLLDTGKLTVNDGQIMNKRCANELQNAGKRVANAQQNGAKGGRPNGLENPRGHSAQKLTTNYQPSTIIKEKKDSRRSASVYDLEYEAFWKVCPRREAKKPAFASWKRARLTTSAEILLAAMERYAVSKSGSEQQYIALPATWLNQERWLDEETSDVYKQDRPTGPPPRPEDIWPDEFGGEVGVAH